VVIAERMNIAHQYGLVHFKQSARPVGQEGENKDYRWLVKDVSFLLFSQVDFKIRSEIE
jgi:hypothetical protein